MSTDNRIRIELATDRRQNVEDSASRSAADLELDAEELEPRIAPSEFPTESLSFSFARCEYSY